MKAFASPTKLAIFAAVLAFSVISLEAQPKAVTAKVRAVRGSAKYSDNGSWRNLRVNDVLQVGSVIETGSESTVDLFINNSVIRITPDTTFGITKALVTETGADTVTDTELYLRSGRILGNVKKLAAASKYQIKTPNGVTGIRGTEFDISYIGNRLVITSLNGTLVGSAANLRGEIKTGVANTGQSWSPDEGITLIPPQHIGAWRERIPRFTIDTESFIPVPQPNQVIIHVEPGIGNGVSPVSPN